MKKLVYISAIIIFSTSMTSCGSASQASAQKDAQIAGYTLKNKKELMEQKISNKKSKTIIATP